MITFSPSSIKENILNAIQSLSFLEGYIEDIEFDEFFDDKKLEDVDEEIIISDNSDVYLSLGDDTYPSIKLHEFINIANNLSELKINEAQSYAKNSREVYFLLDTEDYNTIEVLSNTFKGESVSALEKSVIIDGKIYHVCLFHGCCIYHLLVQKSGNFDDYAPSYSQYDFFVKVHCEDDLDMKIADSLAISYIFELQSSFDLIISFNKGRLPPFEEDRSTETLYGMESSMFPLICGKGSTELLNIYNTARVTSDIDFKILGFTKVIEYISPTISQKELIENVTLKLTSLNVFKPNATFISELGAIYDKHRNTSTKDSELIKTSILTAVSLSLDEIWDCIPNFIKGRQETLPLEQERIAFLEKISECIYSTRNEIAHAKANYEKRGTECPEKHKEDFCKMLDIIAVRCIRWFALQPEDKRVVLE